jgi:hypothetical protein
MLAHGSALSAEELAAITGGNNIIQSASRVALQATDGATLGLDKSVKNVDQSFTQKQNVFSLSLDFSSLLNLVKR